ncbi:MAG: hypothetical protein ACKO39_13695, partial [Chthoniobacterales bacterium]
MKIFLFILTLAFSARAFAQEEPEVRRAEPAIPVAPAVPVAAPVAPAVPPALPPSVVPAPSAPTVAAPEAVPAGEIRAMPAGITTDPLMALFEQGN